MTEQGGRDQSAARLKAAQEGLKSSAVRTAAVWAEVLQQTSESTPLAQPAPVTGRFVVRGVVANGLRKLAAALEASKR